MTRRQKQIRLAGLAAALLLGALALATMSRDDHSIGYIAPSGRAMNYFEAKIAGTNAAKEKAISEFLRTNKPAEALPAGLN